MKKILIADSGSTKTDWSLVIDGKLVKRLCTKGMNPFFRSQEDMREELCTAVASELDSSPLEAVYFYGAGCVPEKLPFMLELLASSFEVEQEAIEVASDMLAAARAAAGHEPGIVGILGTGSNSCLYNGRDIVRNVPALGFILGDEGSGAVLGRTLVNFLLKNQAVTSLRDLFLTENGLTQASIIERVYRGETPNRFLASLSPFLARHLEEPALHDLALGAFKKFFLHNVMQYEEYSHTKVHLVGSVAYHYQDVIREAARAYGIAIGAIIQSPMEGLIQYHQS
jgi:N-acetylglucosamine kinase-like BadF-type ATPase